MEHFSAILTGWYTQHHRDLPWRNTRDPYHIWLSEIILQQTRVDQGMAYYLKFVNEFPSVNELSSASEDQVLRLWQGLGYYSRARNLHNAAQTIVAEHQGKFPSDYHQIRALKGVGDYTAAAVASFAFGLPYAVVDGNVYRVLARYFGIHVATDSAAGKKEFAALAQRLLAKDDPALHNQAVMEFGALQCKPVNPDCTICPLNATCAAYSSGSVSSLPRKEKKVKVRDRFFNYVILHHKNTTAITRRPENDIWQSLYDFPMIETPGDMPDDKFFSLPAWTNLIKNREFTIRSVSPLIRHVLSHQKIHARFREIELSFPLKEIVAAGNLLIDRKDIVKYAVPRLIENYLSDPDVFYNRARKGMPASKLNK